MHPFLRKHLNSTSTSSGQRNTAQNRGKNNEKSNSEASLKEYEETIKETMEYNRAHPRVYNKKLDETPLRMKEGILLESIKASVDSSVYCNKNRLGPDKENTFQCLKRSRSTSSMGINNSMPSLGDTNEGCDSTMNKSRSINIPHQLNISLDLESSQHGTEYEPTKGEEFSDSIVESGVGCSAYLVNDTKPLISCNQDTNLSDGDNRVLSDSSSDEKCFDDNEISKCNEKYTKEALILNRGYECSRNSNLKTFSKPNECVDVLSENGPDGFKYVDMKVVMDLKKLLLGSALDSFSRQWMCQSFILNSNPKLQYGFIQNKGGACGVLAPVQGFLLKALLFSSPPITNNTHPLRPDAQEVKSALIQAICDILWQAGNYNRAVLVCFSEESHLESTHFYNTDNLTELLCYKTFTSIQELQATVEKYLFLFTSREGQGCLLFIIAVILSRGIKQVIEDMDDESCELIANNGTCALELVTLLLTGRAVSNVFDNNIQLDSCILKGVTKRSDIGFLSLYEHYDSCQVGSFLKTPRHPIWIINSTNHFSLIFSICKQLVSDWRAEKQFQLYHYDGLNFPNDEVILFLDTKGLESSDFKAKKEEDEPILNLCVRTKWKEAAIQWTTNINK
uniref:Ubiquitin carboxyl-terminal hydrolase MINDY n=1 Tax=Clastoptera arizonana TaxID=38151 RepID=A0A1B6CJA8_9HEMI